MNEKPNSKLRLPKVTIRSQIIPQPKSPRWLKKGKQYEQLWATKELLWSTGSELKDMC